MFKGTLFDSHADIVERWKMEVEERERRSWTGKKVEKWRISAEPRAFFMKIKGLYWGYQQGDSLIHDLRGGKHYYFAQGSDLVFDHDVDGLLEDPSELVLTSLDVQP